MIDALARLRREDVPALELLFLQGVMAWVFSEENPGSDYNRSHASYLAGALFTGLDDAGNTSLSASPPETAKISAARDRVALGANALASYGEAGLDMLLEQRVLPAMVGELERCVGNQTQQGACTWTYALFAVAMGEGHDQDPDVVEGLIESFDAWSALLSQL
ncbi:hypothetical protein [Actinomycetospora sp. NBRC 106378]|uniref:hypothetical protein n=1 Tax=Actinomycetospora sp. NBRC 106378 TaxID=3032208 RepID=UPI0025527ACE|nr:hypothetical protein [Actinomycetospora sp. NBRC 106378]